MLNNGFVGVRQEMLIKDNHDGGASRPPLHAALVAAAVIAAVPAGAADRATAAVTANVVEPIAIASGAALSFGTFANGGTQGSVTVSTAGTLTSSGGVSHTAGPAAAASFAITGAPGATFRLAATVVALTDGKGHTMPLDLIGDFDGAGATTPGMPAAGTLAGGSQTLHLGGRLSVAAGQAPGAYSGEIGVEVSYQ